LDGRRDLAYGSGKSLKPTRYHPNSLVAVMVCQTMRPSGLPHARPYLIQSTPNDHLSMHLHIAACMASSDCLYLAICRSAQSGRARRQSSGAYSRSCQLRWRPCGTRACGSLCRRPPQLHRERQKLRSHCWQQSEALMSECSKRSAGSSPLCNYICTRSQSVR